MGSLGYIEIVTVSVCLLLLLLISYIGIRILKSREKNK